MTESMVWPGIRVDNIDQVMEFEEWFLARKGSGRYIGENLQIIGGPLVEPGETVGWTGESWVMVR